MRFFGPGRGFDQFAIWTIAVFLAVLAHEAGHALTARAYGLRQVSITLFALGGATTFPVTDRLTPARRFVISAAGSAVGIVLGGIVGLLWLNGVFDDATELVRLAALSFIWAGLGWGVLNWIPIRPLDGGQMLTSALQIVNPARGAVIARVISGIVGGSIVVASLVLERVTPTDSDALLWANRMNWTYIAIFVAFITVIGLKADPVPPPGSEEAMRPPAPGGGDRRPRPIKVQRPTVARARPPRSAVVSHMTSCPDD